MLQKGIDNLAETEKSAKSAEEALEHVELLKIEMKKELKRLNR